MEEIHLQAGKTKWFRKPHDYGYAIGLLAQFILFAVLAYFIPFVILAAFIFIPLSFIALFIYAKKAYYFGIGENGIVLKNKIMVWKEQFFAYSDLALANLETKQERGGVFYTLHLHLKDGNQQKFNFSDKYEKDLGQLDKALNFRNINVRQDIVRGPSAKNRNALIILAFIPTTIIVGAIAYYSYQHEQAKESLRNNYALTVATTTGIDDVGHGNYSVDYTYELNGKTFYGSSADHVTQIYDSGELIDNSYYYREYQPDGKEILHKVEIEGEKLLLAYDKMAPAHSLLILEYPVTDSTDFGTISAKSEWFDRY